MNKRDIGQEILDSIQEIKSGTVGRVTGLRCNEEIDRLAKLAVERKKNDTRSEAQIIADGVAFIMDTRLGGP